MSLYIILDNSTAAEILTTDSDKIMIIIIIIKNWAKTWLVNFDPLKIESLLISRKINTSIHPQVFMLDQQIKEAEFHKHLGVYLYMT